jgi:hypothetical protein
MRRILIREHLFFWAFLVLGLAVVSQAGSEGQNEKISTPCALAIFATFQQLAKEPAMKAPDIALQDFLVKTYEDVRCELRGDEAVVVLLRPAPVQGGSIYYRIGLKSLDVREKQFGR